MLISKSANCQRDKCSHIRMIMLGLLLAFAFLSMTNLVHAAKKYNKNKSDADRRYLDSLQRDIRNLESQVKKLDSTINDRQKQLKDAPKTIDPAKQAVTKTDKTFLAARDVVGGKKRNLDAAQLKLNEVLKSLKSEFDGAPEYLKAEQKVVETQRKFEETLRPLRKSLEADFNYKRVSTSVSQSRIRMELASERQSAGRASPTEVRDAASDLLRFQTQLAALERKAFETDQKYLEAKGELQAAEANLKEVKLLLRDRLKANPKYAAADQAIAAAKAAYGEAQRAMSLATKERTAARSTLIRLESQVRKFTAETKGLIGRKSQLEYQVRAKEKRYRDFQRRK
jgi:chromosome segregation ATPase